MASAPFMLDVVGALSGESLCTLLADPCWTVHRLKTEIANHEIAPHGLQSLLFGGRGLEDKEVVGVVLAGEERPSLALLRTSARQAQVTLDSADGRLCVSRGIGVSHITWTVKEQRLRANQSHLLSPVFDLNLGNQHEQVPFKLVVSPKGAVSFKKSRGFGRVQLKCNPELPEEVANMDVQISVGGEGQRGPFPHNFRLNALCGLPAAQDAFDLWGGVDPSSANLEIRVSVWHCG